MVRTLVAFILVFALPVLAASPYKLDPATVALGEPVTLTLTARPGILEKIDLTSVGTDFEILGRTLGSDGREETLVLTLYPLHTGRIALPDLGLRGRPPVVVVTEQSETTPKVRFDVGTSPDQYHVRQFIRLTIEACDDGSLMWQRPKLATREGVLLRPLNEEQIDLERDGERCTAHRWHWSVLLTATGITSVPVPMLEANKFGQRLRFQPPLVQLDALPVPAWLPSDVAIGRPEVSLSPLPEQWSVNRPLGWRFEVIGGYSIEALRNLLQLQLANQPQFSNYPPSVEELKSDNGVPRHAVSIYPVLRERGDLKLPDLVFPWYDPETDQLQQLHVPGSLLHVVDPARQRLMNWLLGVSMLALLIAFAHLLWGRLGWRLRRYAALRRIRQVANIEELAQALRAFSLRPGNSPAATLGEWQQRMQEEAEVQFLPELVSAVDEVRYGKAETELKSLLFQAMECLSTARPA